MLLVPGRVACCVISVLLAPVGWKYQRMSESWTGGEALSMENCRVAESPSRATTSSAADRTTGGTAEKYTNKVS